MQIAAMEKNQKSYTRTRNVNAMLFCKHKASLYEDSSLCYWISQCLYIVIGNGKVLDNQNIIYAVIGNGTIILLYQASDTDPSEPLVNVQIVIYKNLRELLY